MATVRIHKLRHAYPSTGFALSIDELEIQRGEKVAIVGRSGAGKSTLLKLIAGVLVPNAGCVEACGKKWSQLAESPRRAHRAACIGFIFQDFDLLDYLPVLENILLPYIITRPVAIDASLRERAREIAVRCGLEHRLTSWPAQLSQGERQRVAICRGLIKEPELLLADEPTGSLDRATASQSIGLLLDHVRQHGATLIMVTHDTELLSQFDRVLHAESWS